MAGKGGDPCLPTGRFPALTFLQLLSGVEILCQDKKWIIKSINEKSSNNFIVLFCFSKKEPPSSAALVGAGKKRARQIITASRQWRDRCSYVDHLCYCYLYIGNSTL